MSDLVLKISRYKLLIPIDLNNLRISAISKLRRSEKPTLQINARNVFEPWSIGWNDKDKNRKSTRNVYDHNSNMQ